MSRPATPSSHVIHTVAPSVTPTTHRSSITIPSADREARNIEHLARSRCKTIDRNKLAGLLADRLAFERAAAEHYAAVLPLLRAAEPAVERIVPQLEQQLLEEQEHARWLEAQLARLRAEPELVRAHLERTRAAHAALLGERGASVLELISSLHRLEIADVDGWELLAAVAARAADEPARRDLGARCEAEQRHRRFVHRVLVELAVNQTIGEPVTLPIAP